MVEEVRVLGGDGFELNVITYMPTGRLKGVLHILHGMAEHGKRYEAFAAYLNEAGIGVWVQEQRHHGRSLGDQPVGYFGKEDTLDMMLLDVDLVEKTIQMLYKDVDHYLMGHSMGSLIARAYVSGYGYQGKRILLMGSPYVSLRIAQISLPISELVYRLNPKKPSEFLDKMTIGPFNKAIKNPKTPSDWLSRDEAEVAKYISDPLCGYAYTAPFYKMLAKAGIVANAPYSIKKWPIVPTLFISGEMDPCSRQGQGFNKIVRAYQRAGKRIDSILMKDMRHEVLHERDYELAFEVCRNFLNDHN